MLVIKSRYPNLKYPKLGISVYSTPPEYPRLLNLGMNGE
jgi:hypothetical protein